MAKLRLAIAGIGNCASALVQGLSYYRTGAGHESGPGLMHSSLGGYGVDDIRLAAAFDVHRDKVGSDVAAAIWLDPNNTLRFADVAATGVIVERGPTLDGVGPQLGARIVESPLSPVDVAQSLRRSRADVLVSFLPVGSQIASEYYAEAALAAGCAYVNCIPVFLASRAEWRAKFEARRLPIIGDDIKSQVGATIVHRVLANIFRERGVEIARTYQLNFGGNTDFLNMLDRDRLESKKISKTQSVSSQIDQTLQPDNIHIGPSDFVPWLTDRKVAHIRLEGLGFGNAPINIELKLEVWDSPNAAGVVIDAIRCAKLAMDRGIGGAIAGPSAYYMKSPPQQYSETEALRMTEAFISGA